MKRTHVVLLQAFVLAVAFNPALSHAQDTPYAVAVRDANSRIWERMV